MAFVLSGSTITQSGTDTSLAGLSAIAGVTTTTITGLRYPLTIYTLSARQLRITGNLPMSRNEKLIFTGQGASNGILNIDGGTFTVNQVYTRNSYAYSLPQEAIVFALSSDGIWNTEVLVVNNAGKLIVKNSLIRIPHSIWFKQNTSGQVLLENVVIDKTGSTGDIQTNHAGTGNNNTVLRNVTILADGQSGITFRNAIPPTVENVKVIQSRDAFNNESGQPQVVRGLEPQLGNLVDVSQFSGNTTIAINPQQGVQFLWGGHLANDAGNVGNIGVYQEITAKVTDQSGANIQNAVFYLTDNPVVADPAQNTLPNATLTGSVNPVNRQVYIATSNASGVVGRQDILIGSGRRTTGGLQIAGGNNNRVRPRGINTTASVDATDDVYNYSVLGYAYLQANNPIVLKSGNGNAINATPQLLPDTNVTLSETNAVAKLASSFTVSTSTNTITVTANSTLDDLYDVMKAYKTRNVQAQLEYPTIATQPVNASGTNLVTAMNIVVNSGVTISEGVKFKSFTTTGTVTDNGEIFGSYTDSTGTRVTIRTTDNLELSTYITIDGVPQGWQVGQTLRRIFVTSTSVIRIYAHAYGYQPKIINVTGNDPNDYITSLLPETNVDTTLNETTRDTIASSFLFGADAFSRLFLSVNSDLRQYTPAEVLNALHYFSVTQGELIATAATFANSVAGFSLMRGGFIVASPAFYGKVADSVTTTTNLGILVPLSIYVDPSVYIAVPTYTPVEKNTSGIVLQYAPWTQQEADIPSWVAKEASVLNLKTNTDKIATLTEDVDGLRFTAKALEQAPSGGGGSGLTLAQIEASTVLAKEATILQSEIDIISEINANEVKIDAVKTKVDTLQNADFTATNAKIDTKPSLAQIEGSTVIAKEATSQTINTKVQTLSNYNDTTAQGKLDAIKAKTDTLVNTDISTLSKKADTDLLLKAADYVAPDNTKIAQIKTKIDTLENYDDTVLEDKVDAIKAKTDTLVNTDLTVTNAKIDALGNPLQENDYLAPDNDSIAKIKTNTDLIPATL